MINLNDKFKYRNTNKINISNLVSWEEVVKDMSPSLGEPFNYMPYFPLRPEKGNIREIKGLIREKKEDLKVLFKKRLIDNKYIQCIHFAPMLDSYKFQLYYINKKTGVFLEIDEEALRDNSIPYKDFFCYLEELLSFEDKFDIAPFFLKLEILSIWIDKLELEEGMEMNKEQYSLIHCFQRYLYEFSKDNQNTSRSDPSYEKETIDKIFNYIDRNITQNEEYLNLIKNTLYKLNVSIDDAGKIEVYTYSPIDDDLLYPGFTTDVKITTNDRICYVWYLSKEDKVLDTFTSGKYSRNLSGRISIKNIIAINIKHGVPHIICNDAKAKNIYFE